VSVIWHDLECGAYVEDLPFWRALAREHGDPILDVGAGTGRVALDLAGRGHKLTALDLDAGLLAELERRCDGLAVETVVADARAFALDRRFALCLVPMQTIQLLGSADGRVAFLRCAREHLMPGGLLAIAIAEQLEPYDIADGGPAPVPDMCERDGIVYSSAPTAIRSDGDSFVLERRRETVSTTGARAVGLNTVRLDRVSARELELEARATGLKPRARGRIAATEDYVGSAVVMLGA